MVSRLYMIRHAEAAGNVKGFTSRSDEENGLTQFGLAQADLIGQWFAKTGIRFSSVVSSHLTRAKLTAGEILKHQPAGVPWSTSECYAELDNWAHRQLVVDALHHDLMQRLKRGNVLLVSHYYTMRAIFEHLTDPRNQCAEVHERIGFCQVFVWDDNHGGADEILKINVFD